MNPDTLPAVVEARAWEADTRSRAFLDATQILCGVEVLPLTLYRLGLLLAARNPFFCGGSPTEGSVAVFLWLVSPRFQVADEAARVAFIAELRASGALGDLSACVRQVGDYLDEMFLDAPGDGGGPGKAPVTSSEAVFVDIFADAYGWTTERTLHEPLPQVYQLLRRITLRRDPEAKFINRRSDKVRRECVRSHQAALAAADSSDPSPP